jgi:hypothetical protein
MIWNSNLTVEMRDRDIEAWFERWVSEKRQFLDRGSSREAKTSSHEQTKKTIDKMVDTAVGQEQSSHRLIAKPSLVASQTLDHVGVQTLDELRSLHW